MAETEVIELRQINHCCAHYQKPKEGKILDALKKIYSYAPLGTELENKSNAVLKLVDEWFRFKMSKHYPELSPKIFEIQRDVLIDLTKHSVYSSSGYRSEKLNEKGLKRIKIPLFCNANLGEEIWEYRCNDALHRIDFKSNVPFIPDEAIQAVAVAKRHCYEIYTKALKTQPLDEILTMDPTAFPDPSQAEMKVAWYARPHELKVNITQNKDPAIVLNWRRPYLVHQWDENTLPIEDILTDALKP